eukprot:6534703-Pyramimonas_sp.AAC.1
MEDILANNRFPPQPPPAAAASYLDKRTHVYNKNRVWNDGIMFRDLLRSCPQSAIVPLTWKIR